MRTDEEVSQLVARIDDLQRQLAAAVARSAGDSAQIAQLGQRLSDAQSQADRANKLQERVIELEKMLAPAAPGSGILTVTYSDGRTKYAAANGDKFTTSAEASHRNMVLAVQKATGVTEAQAEMIVARKDTLVTALSA